ncbi:MAG TPA: hypothetical protein DD640_09575, partial [Clostridiales bacterium]|nr:hypothetical protein [Clostridiales bacterium]
MSHQGKKAGSHVLPARTNKRTWQLAAIAGLLLILAAVLWKTCSGPRDIDLQGYVRSEEATDYVAIVTNRDDRAIIIELYPDIAPITVENFQKLVGEKFYDGLTFHRIVPDAIIQGGDPKGNGSGGPGYTIQGEFAKNGISNTLKHTRGTVSMARTAEP